ncbi:MAG: hypothetical protein HC929_19050, partial [Leptolyngbyaceae cyanobacterium SM2_5_2]|nr:hypothetical protein [Leptolyngbyaceae cyanobacterium SM2_5_2]
MPQVHIVKAEDSSRIFSVAGTASVSLGSTQSGGGFGFGFAWNDIQNTTEAVVKNSQLDYADSLQVLAQNDSKIQTVSASVGVSQAQQTAATIAGTASVNQIDNLTRAQVIGSTLRGLSGGVGGATRILAQDQAAIQSVSGAVSVAISGAGLSLGFGAAIAYNAIGNRSGHHTLATVENSTLTVDSLTVKATGEQIIQSIAASVAAAVSGKAAVSLAGAVTINDLEGLRIEGSITGSTVTTVKAVQVSADNRSEINSMAGQVAVAIGSKGGGALGAAVAINDIGDGTDPVQVSAFISNSTVTSTTGAIDLLATSSAKIWTISAGVQAAGGAALGDRWGYPSSLN